MSFCLTSSSLVALFPDQQWGRARVWTLKLPVATPKDAIESIESSHVPLQRTRGRPRKVELLAKKKQKILELNESGETTSPAFERFQELPEDLRLKIWKLTLPGPRLVEISLAALKQPFINSHRSTPSILHVCSESREEALKWYSAFPLGLDFDPSRGVYVNFQIDTLYFSDPTFFSMYWGGARYGLRTRRIEQLMNDVRFIAIVHTAIDEYTKGEFTRRFCKLEELTRVAIDVGDGEITDENELDVWDEWQIGEVTCKYLQGNREWDKLCRRLKEMYDLWCFRAPAARSQIGQTDEGRRVDVELMIDLAMMMTTMGCDVWKDVKAKILAVDRAGKSKFGRK